MGGNRRHFQHHHHGYCHEAFVSIDRYIDRLIYVSERERERKSARCEGDVWFVGCGEVTA